LVVNPRGFRAYVRSDTFFKAIPHVLAERPDAQFACVAMAGKPVAEAWVSNLRVQASVTLLGRLAPGDMARLLKRGDIMASLTEHDGTPNTLLEAMACEALPVVGELASVAEWIEDGVNGRLVDAGDARATAQAIVDAIEQSQWRDQAVKRNRARILETATRPAIQDKALRFYKEVLASST
jgi:glycosyltransferase involved in cell wall biosynthesis